MNELVMEISSSLNISQEKAREAVYITSSYLCRKLPGNMNEQVEAVLLVPEIEDVEAREVGLFPMP